jgi:hypothetical protein
MQIKFSGYFSFLDSGSIWVKGGLYQYPDNNPKAYYKILSFQQKVYPEPDTIKAGESKSDAYIRHYIEAWTQFKLKIIEQLKTNESDLPTFLPMRNRYNFATQGIRNFPVDVPSDTPAESIKQLQKKLQKNAKNKLRRYAHKLGFPLTILHPLREGRFGHIGIAAGLLTKLPGLAQGEESIVTADMGGMSTEIVYNNHVCLPLSIPIGRVNFPPVSLGTLTQDDLCGFRIQIDHAVNSKPSASKNFKKVHRRKPRYLVIGSIPTSIRLLVDLAPEKLDDTVQRDQPKRDTDGLIHITKTQLQSYLIPQNMNHIMEKLRATYPNDQLDKDQLDRFPVYIVLYDYLMEKLKIDQLIIGKLGGVIEGALIAQQRIGHERPALANLL